VPTSTDLVKDGATAIEALGDGIDTSLVDLKGGTTGQILAKATSADMDFAWITNDVGDITEVTAGTGISGGGTSGAVTITNSMATEIAAKGDLIVGTGAATFDNLAAGANGLPLVTDSGATTGLKWGYTNSISAFLYKAAAQSIPNATWTAVTFSDEAWDTNSFHDTSTNTSRITIPAGLAGKYAFNLRGFFAANATGVRYIAVYLNGVSVRINYFPANAADFEIALNTKINLVATDYVEMYVFQNSGGSLNFTASATEGEFSTNFIGV
jgi:hypothetical protein